MARRRERCKWCGGEILPPKTVYCSGKCSRAFKNFEKRASASLDDINEDAGMCDYCGEGFTKQYPGELYCCASCRWRAAKKRREERQ